MLKKAVLFIVIAALSLGMSSCGPAGKYQKYEVNFTGLFDTYTTITGYTKNEADFTKYTDMLHAKLTELDHDYDIYNNYPGLNNAKTINDNAGITPVKVDSDLLNLIQFSVEAYTKTEGALNIGLGPVLAVWADYRTAGNKSPDTAAVPSMEQLRAANQYTDIRNIVVDKSASTVFIKDKNASIDLGATGKGYAVQLAAGYARSIGFDSCIIDCGGNVLTVGKPLDGVRARWGIGIQNPFEDIDGTNNILDIVYVDNMAVVSSGDYQRFYTVNGVRYNHVIDPASLMPANLYEAVTVIYPDSGIADMLSTPLDILPQNKGEALAEKYGAGVIWVMHDGTIMTNALYDAVSKNKGYSAVDP